MENRFAAAAAAAVSISSLVFLLVLHNYFLFTDTFQIFFFISHIFKLSASAYISLDTAKERRQENI
jgi:hypothetical protein